MTNDKPPSRKYAQPLLHLGGSCVSTEAKGLHAHLRDQIILPSLTGQQKRPSSLPAIERALEGAISGLALAIPQWDGWTRRPMGNDSFTSEGVSARQFQKVYSALEASGLIDTAPGFLDRSGPAPRGAETRIRLSETGRDLLVSFGIKLEGVGLHYVAGSLA